MLSPFAPHIAEEMWEKLGNTELVSKSAWPAYYKDGVDATAIQSENLLKVLWMILQIFSKLQKLLQRKL